MTSQEIAEITAKYALQEEPYVDMPYSKFHTMLKDVNDELLKTMSQDVINLSEGKFSSPPFPVTGKIFTPNMRLMIPLLFQKSNQPNGKVLNVWCVLDTTSVHTCLSVKTLEAFIGKGNVKSECYYFNIQRPNCPHQCFVSKVGSDFEHANIIGMHALRVLKTLSIEKLKKMAQGLGYNTYFYGEEDDEINSGFRRYEEDVDHSQNLVIHGFEDDSQDPIQVGANHQEVPHEEHQLVAREESPVSQQFLQYEEVAQWDYYETDNQVENQESPHQQEPSQQIQQLEDQDYQVEYPQYRDKGLLNHQQMPHVVQQHQPRQSHQMMPAPVCQMEHQVDHLSTTQVRPQQQRVQRVQPVNQQHQHEMDLFDAPQPPVQKTGPLFFSPLEHPLNGATKWKNQQRNQTVSKPGPPQHSQPMKQPMTSQVNGMSYQIVQQIAHQARPQQQKVSRVQPVNSQPAHFQNEMNFFTQAPLQNKEPNFQGQGTSPLVFSPLQHPLNGVLKWAPVYPQAPLQNKAPNMESQGSGSLKFSPMVHPITKVPYEIPQNVSQLTRPTQRVEEMEEPSQITENPRSRWNRLTEEQKKRSNIKRTENRQKKRIRDAQKAQEEKEKQGNVNNLFTDNLEKLRKLNAIWPL